jgi:hypothetical protein
MQLRATADLTRWEARGRISRGAFIYVAVVCGLVFAGVGALALAGGAFGSDATSPQRMTSSARVLHVGDYELLARSVPRQIGTATSMSIELLRGGQPVDGARVRVTFSMPDMPRMRALTRLLPQTVAGVYVQTSPILTIGRWQVRFEITPRHGRSFGAGFVYRIDD